MQAKILLVDDHPVFRKGLRILLEDEKDMCIAGEANDGQTAIALISELTPDLIVMDVSMPGFNGIETTKRIVSEFPDSVIVALSIHSEKQFVRDMLLAGASGYILKESVPEELVKGIRAVLNGEGYLSSAITEDVVLQFRESVSNHQHSQEKDIEILDTKIQLPLVPEEHVYRRNLVEFLEFNRQLPLQLVTAPAGYGKSTLVSSWLTEHEWQKSWVSFDENDNDMSVFLSYFLHAICIIFPNSLSKSFGLLKAANSPPIQIIATTMANEINLIEKDFVLVFDDFHFIKDKGVHDLLAELLHYPPRNMHLVLIARTDSFLPKTILRAKGMLSEIRLLDLQFTEKETEEYLQYTFHQKIDTAIVKEWHEKTEGWITGLRLGALSLQHRNVLSLGHQVNEAGLYAREYLFNEVLATQPESIRFQIFHVSIVDQFNAPLCDHLWHHFENKCEVDGWGLIKIMKRENIFLMQLDNNDGWFRFHLQFRELLKKQLERYCSPDEISQLHCNASSWFAQNGLFDEAIKHALEGGDIKGAVKIVEENIRPMMNTGRWFILANWLLQLPDEAVQKSPQLLLVQVLTYFYHMDIEKIPSTLDRIDKLMDGVHKGYEISGEVAAFRGVFSFFQGDFVFSQQYLEHALNRVATSDSEFRGITELYFALAGQALGQMERVSRKVTEWLSDVTALHPMRESRLYTALALIDYIDNNITAANSHLPRLRQVAERYKLANGLARCDYLQGLFHLQRGELDMAIQLLKAAAERQCYHFPRAAADVLGALALAYQANGQPEQAQKTLKLLDDFATFFNTLFTALAHSYAARLALMQGQTELAVHWLKTKVHLSVEVMIFWFEIPGITFCRALIAEGSATSLLDAEERLCQHEKKCESQHNTCQLIGILCLQAYVCDLQGKKGEALTVLKRALMLAKPGGFVFPFLELGQPMAGLLKRLDVKKNKNDYVETILAAIKDRELKTASTAAEHSSDNKPGGTQLTARELEILSNLTLGKTNIEISKRLFISVETVKSHLKKIYRKLNVTSRLQAVTKANSFVINDSK